MRLALTWLIAVLVLVIVLQGTLGSLDVAIEEWARKSPSWGPTLGDRIWTAWMAPLVTEHSAMTFYSLQWSPWLADGVLILPASTILWPLSFFLLPDTRSRAKVRRVHIVRAFVYSWCWLAILLLPWIFKHVPSLIGNCFELLGMAAPAFIEDISRSASRLVNDRGPATVVVPLCIWLWLALWWLFAIRRGLRLQHAWGVWLALLIINGLATPIALALWSILMFMIFGADE